MLAVSLLMFLSISRSVTQAVNLEEDILNIGGAKGTYFANLEYPKALLGLGCKTSSKPAAVVPFTIFSVKDSMVTE